MNFIKSTLQDAYIIENTLFADPRGEFTKTFNKIAFQNAGIYDIFDECFFSTSHKNVLRGMHIQHAPHDCSKLVFVTSGEILDVWLDLRPDSPTYGQYDSAILSNKKHNMVYVPKGFAHGFLSLRDETTVVYLQSECYNSTSDSGILWDSLAMDWGVKDPILSDRDKSFITLAEYSKNLPS